MKYVKLQQVIFLTFESENVYKIFSHAIMGWDSTIPPNTVGLFSYKRICWSLRGKFQYFSSLYGIFSIIQENYSTMHWFFAKIPTWWWEIADSISFIPIYSYVREKSDSIWRSRRIPAPVTLETNTWWRFNMVCVTYL